MVKDILALHGFVCDNPMLASTQGVANATWLCDDVVLRVSKAPQYLTDLFTESVVAPAVFEHGVRSPEPLFFGLDAEPPYSIYKRALGTNLSDAIEITAPMRFYTEYGRMLRQTHDIALMDDPDGYLDEPWFLQPDKLKEAADEFDLHQEVEALIPHTQSERVVFAHQDLHAENVIVSPEGLPVFLDWGDGGFGDAACDLRFIPPRFMPWVMEGYGEHSDETLMKRVALHVLEQYLYVTKHQKSYGQMGNSTLVEIRAFVQQWA